MRPALLLFVVGAVAVICLISWIALVGPPVSVLLAEPGVEPVDEDDRPRPDPPSEALLQRELIETLFEKLEQRDAAIADLMRRVEQLERQVADAAAPTSSAPTPTAAEPTVTESTATAAAEPQPRRTAETTEALEPPQTEATKAADAGTTAPAPAGQDPAPGQFDVEEDDIDRALERTLVQVGALLLPVGRAELESSLRYTRREVELPIAAVNNNTVFIGEQQLRRNEFDTRLILRAGLPFDSQFEFSLPFRVVQEETVSNVGPLRRVSDGTGTGFGDPSLALAKTLVREHGWWPDLIARVGWDSDFGKRSDNDVLLSGGFNEFTGSLSATKRQDPLVFVGRASYSTSLENDGIEPGDALGFSIGTLLAASPETSLSLSLSQEFVDNTKLDGRGIAGSDRTNSILNIGASSILGRGVFLSGSVGIGLTEDAPDYSVSVSVPIRFDLPIH